MALELKATLYGALLVLIAFALASCDSQNSKSMMLRLDLDHEALRISQRMDFADKLADHRSLSPALSEESLVTATASQPPMYSKCVQGIIEAIYESDLFRAFISDPSTKAEINKQVAKFFSSRFTLRELTEINNFCETDGATTFYCILDPTKATSFDQNNSFRNSQIGQKYIRAIPQLMREIPYAVTKGGILEYLRRNNKVSAANSLFERIRIDSSNCAQ